MSLLCPLDSPPYSIRPIPFWILRALCSLRLFPASRQVICLFPTARERSISSVDGPCSHSEEGPGRPRRGAVRTLRVEPASQKCAPRRPPLGPARVLRGILGRRRSIAPAGTHLRTGAAHGTNRSPIPQNRYRPGTACPSEGEPMKKRLGTTGELFPQSVFIIATYDEEGTPNAMNAAWAGECGRIGRRLGQDACQDGRRLPPRTSCRRGRRRPPPCRRRDRLEIRQTAVKHAPARRGKRLLCAQALAYLAYRGRAPKRPRPKNVTRGPRGTRGLESSRWRTRPIPRSAGAAGSRGRRPYEPRSRYPIPTPRRAAADA